MELTFIGTGSAFSKKNYNSNMVLAVPSEDGKPRRMLIDCGRTAPEALAAVNLNWGDIEAVYVSHAHSDHAGGLEEYAFMRKYVYKNQPKPHLVAEMNLLYDLWDFTLKGGLAYSELEPENPYYFSVYDFFTVMPAKASFWCADTVFTLHKNQHVMPSYGISFRSPSGKHVYISTDSLVRSGEFYEQFDVIFHDAEISPFKSGVHAHYTHLLALPAEVKSRMHLYHYQDVEKPDAVTDGFAGFVEQGAVYKL